MKLIINRLAEQERKQTVGDLYLYDEFGQVLFECRTLELPWVDNKQSVSCIPPGPGQGEKIYPFVILDESPSFKYPHIWIKDVPNRSFIKIHVGNYHHEIEGCVLVGDKLSDRNSDGLLDVVNSRVTLERMIDIMRDVIGKEEGEIIFHNGRFNTPK